MSAPQATPTPAKTAVKNQERLMQVLLAPQVSEKSTYVAEKNEQVVFRVVGNATKPDPAGTTIDHHCGGVPRRGSPRRP